MARGRTPWLTDEERAQRAEEAKEYRRNYRKLKLSQRPRLWHLGRETEKEFLSRIQAQKESVRQALNY